MFFAGVFVTLMGIMVLVGVGAYALFGLYNESSLDELNTSIQGPVTLPETPETNIQARQQVAPPSDDPPETTIEVIRNVQPVVEAEPRAENVQATNPPSPEAKAAAPSEEASTPAPRPAEAAKEAVPSAPEPVIAEAPAPEQPETVAEVVVEVDTGALVAAYDSLYPGDGIHPKYWDNPLTAGSDEQSYAVAWREGGFREVTASDGLPRGTLADAIHVVIPSIGVDSEVTNLAILDMGDSRQYETPAHVVGRIPQTANPGEVGNTWLFGHLESPILGEGNVFRRLPEIPEIMKNGDPVYVIILNEDSEEFIYQITDTTVMHRDDLSLYDTDDSTVTLVTCVPRLIYDRRLVVSGKLVGIRKPA